MLERRKTREADRTGSALKTASVLTPLRNRTNRSEKEALPLSRARKRNTRRSEDDVRSAYRIAQGKQEKLQLGHIEIKRDWGWAPEYVEAMYRMVQQESPEDFVIATGETRKLQDFVAAAFEGVALDWRDHTTTDQVFFRPTEIMIGRGNPTKAAEKLDWRAKYKMAEVVQMMLQAAAEAES